MNEDIKKILNEQLNQMVEAFNSPLEITWKKGRDWVGEFTIDNNVYTIHITSHSDKEKHYLFKFMMNDKFDLINDPKKAFTVIPTIQKAANDFLNEVKPNVLMFTALDNSRGRIKFYTMFCNDVKKSKGYDFIIKEMDGKKLFILLKDADPMELLNSIHDVLKSLQH